MTTVHRQKTRNLVKNDERDILTYLLTYLGIDAYGCKLGGELSRELQKMHEQMTMHIVDNHLMRAVVAYSNLLTHYLID